MPIVNISGTAKPVGVMRGILGAGTQTRAIHEWKEFYAHVMCENLKQLVDAGEITRSQYHKVVKTVAAGLHEEFVKVK